MTQRRFEEIRTQAESARTRAKWIRKKNRETPGEADRDASFEDALKLLEQAIQELENWLGETSAFRREAEREIGDCHGVRGGTLRDWGKYEEASKAYDAGLEFERRFHELGGQPNSYCLVQRLVVRVLWKPKQFQQGESIRGINVQAECESSARTVQEQMEVLRKGDPWAQADVALLLQFLGEKADERYGDDAAEKAWDMLDDMRPDKSVYVSTLDVVELIVERLCPYMSKCSWVDVRQRLTRT